MKKNHQREKFEKSSKQERGRQKRRKKLRVCAGRRDHEGNPMKEKVKSF